MSPMTEVLTTIVKGLVDEPEKVALREVKGDQTLVIYINVAKPDIGKVIGKKGVMAESLRIILRAISTKHQQRAVMEIEA